MNMTPLQQKKLLVVLLSALVILTGFRVLTAEKPRTAPLTYTRGAVARSSVRAGVQTRTGNSDPLHAFLARREEKYPGVHRDLFRMENPVAAKSRPAIKTAPTPTVPAPPPVPEKTPEEIAAEASRADLSKFRFLGYLTDKESSLFLAKDGETYIVRSGDAVLRNYRVKEAGKDYVVLVDTLTRVEVKIELSGGAEPAGPPQRHR
ncbi:MAG: hypothetical protein A2078_01560 [Nitrospirae bacterium GWC2_57_9]|nr:MAG: hypothetical protein A2078_01560 [Nitrospirae bacterium GWC2_57_9]